MKTSEPDDLLWELPRAEARDDAQAPDDTRLRSYRAGTLSEGEETRLEWSLAGSRRGRARLAELAGIALDASAPRRGRLPWLATTAGLAAAAVIALALLLVPVRRDRELPVYEVSVEGLASERGAARAAQALPDGTVRVRVEPTGDARAGVRFSAYRLDAAALVRLEEPGELRTEESRGSAVLTARAAHLVGASPGTRPFFVVVSEGTPVARVKLESEDPETALRRAGGGQVHRVWLTIVDAREDVR